MNFPEIDVFHKLKCRMCFGDFDSTNNTVQISSEIAGMFFEVTHKTLFLSDEFSKTICTHCNEELSRFCAFKNKTIDLYERLNNFVGFGRDFIKEETELDLPSMLIKSELEDENGIPRIDFINSSETPGVDFIDNLVIPAIDFIDNTVTRPKREKKTPHKLRDLKAEPKVKPIKNKLLIGLRAKPELSFVCVPCGRIFSSRRNLEAHQFIEHSTMPDFIDYKPQRERLKGPKQAKPRKKPNLEKRFSCNHCDKRFRFRTRLETHIYATHHLIQDIPENKAHRCYICDNCGFRSTSKVTLNSHLRRVHYGKLATRNDVTCHICGEIFKYQNRLESHVNSVHLRKKPYLCDICGAGYEFIARLEIHKKSQHGEKDIPCTFCDKLFPTTKHLKTHMKYHNEKTFICPHDDCRKGFACKNHLDYHLQTHSPVPQFNCPQCEKSFYTRKQCLKHINGTHKGEQYFCQLCTFECSRRDNLRSHYFRAHKELSKDEVSEKMPPMKPHNSGGRPLKNVQKVE